jgi:beta-lactam-binding protein with PASTA domain
MKHSNDNKLQVKLPFYKTFLGSVLLIMGVCIALYFIFFASLATITGHGEELKVPDLKGKHINLVYNELIDQGFAVNIDSVYDPDNKPFIILDQLPLPGNTVKPGRHISLSVNKVVPPSSKMPNLINLSFRSAQLVLKSNKLILGDTIIKPDMALGAVVEQIFNGEAISPGTAIAQGSKIDLVIGGGYQSVRVAVPDVLNLTYEVGTSILSASGLNYDIMWEGEITDTASAIIYYQLPEGFDEEQNINTIEKGGIIDLKVKQNL